jgi:hypothetical protein
MKHLVERLRFQYGLPKPNRSEVRVRYEPDGPVTVCPIGWIYPRAVLSETESVETGVVVTEQGIFLLVRLLPEFVSPKDMDVYAIGSRLDEPCAVAVIKDLAVEHMVSWALRYVESKESLLQYSHYDETDYRMAEDIMAEAKRMYLNTEDIKRLLDAVRSGRYNHSPRAMAAVFELLYDMAWDGYLKGEKKHDQTTNSV